MPRVFDLIQPLDTRDTYAITDVLFQKGGLREVENLTARNAISLERRRAGMIAFIIETGEFYSLTGDDLTNESWQKIDFSTNILSSVNLEEISIKQKENSISSSIGDNLSLNVSNTSILKVKEASSIVALSDENVKDGKILFVQNLANKNIIIKNNYFNSLNYFNQTIGGETNLKKIANNGNNFIIISSDGYLKKSSDLQNWENIENIESNAWQSITYGNNIFVAVSNDGENRVIVSNDNGETWTNPEVELHEWKDIIYANNIFIAISSNKIMYSSGGSVWTYVDIPLNSWKNIAYGNNVFVIISENLDGTDAIIYSQDSAVTWIIAERESTDILYKIKFINDKFYLISENDILFSIDGINWEILDLIFEPTNVEEIFFNNDHYFFFKKDRVFYTKDFEYFKEFDFTNVYDINNIFFYNNKYYVLTTNNINEINMDLVENNNYPIFTGTDLDLVFLKNSSIILQFSEIESVWRVISGVALNPTLLDLLDTPDEYPSVAVNNNVYLLVNPDDESENKVIFDNPFPVIANNNDDLVIKNINGLRIRRFDSATGEIIFAKFTPTYNIAMSSPLNFDDQINSITNISVTNDSFVDTTLLNTITNIKYYKNNEIDNQIVLTTTPSVPNVNNNFSWQQAFSFNTISDINSSFGIGPSNFTFIVNLKDTTNKNYELTRTVTYRSPTFSSSIAGQTANFKNTINSSTMTFTYPNVTSRTINSSIQSIVSNIPNGPTFTGLTNGMLTYSASNLAIVAENLTKTNNLSDTATYTFTTVCRYTRPSAIDSNQNFYEITSTSSFNVTFIFSVFTGNTLTSKTSLTNEEVLNLIENDNSNFPRNFSYTVGDSNVHWWFCIRKRHVNGATPIVNLTSGGFTLPTTIIYSNEVDIITAGGSETYVCYCILLQANNTYSMNISI